MGYRDKAVALLLDDPVSPPGSSSNRQTRQTIAMLGSVASSINKAHKHYSAVHLSARRRMRGNADMWQELQHAADTYRSLADWFSTMGQSYRAQDHTDDLFIKKVFQEPAAHYRHHAETIATLSLPARKLKQHLLSEYAFIEGMFNTDITFLQRKAFSNLPHEPNKAMNINSYISLMGGSYIIESDGRKKKLDPLQAGSTQKADLHIPTSDYIITLDADSIIDHWYAATLAEIMQRPENDRVAVAQTPYSAIPGTKNPLERAAGATTDIQYIIHQGFTKFGATYWVGANALLRKTALDDISEPIPGETLVRQYIQDRTVIEDTESSIDLVDKDWTLYNHPQRLAYSATPNDYGSLLIQRRRWANGGLIIMPKLLGYLFLRPALKKVPEGFMRLHYLASIAMVNISLVIMLFVPLEDVGFSIWVPLTALPYFCLYYRDLRQLSYGHMEVLRVYALNLMLIPINMGGVMKSMQQMVTKSKIPFGRTPKVGSRTAAPALYHLVTYGILAYLLFLIVSDLMIGEYLFAAMLVVNAVFMVYALVRFIGVSSSAADIRAAVPKKYRLRRRQNISAIPAVVTVDVDNT